MNRQIAIFLISLFIAGAAFSLKESKFIESSKTYIIDIKRPVLDNPAVNRDLDNFIKQNIAELRKQEPPPPDDPRHYKNSLYIRYDQPFISARYISLVWQVETYEGGAHPNLTIVAKNYDRRSGKPLKLGDITKINKTKLIALLMNKLMASINQPDEDWIKRSLSDYDLNNFSLRTDSITFHFSPDLVAPHAAGRQQVFFKLKELRP